MPLIARQRSRLAALAVLALVGSLLAVSAAPAAAAGDGEVTYKAKYSACVGGATVDAGFEDMVGSFAEDAANCLAYYGITTGTSEGMFSPNASVTRLQMALFLSRAAGPAGAVLPAATDQGFTDIGGMTDSIQAAINQVAAAGIMVGRSDTEFMPTDMVTREDMSVHLAALLDQAVTGPGGTDIGETTAAKSGIEPVNVDDVFTDIGRVTYSANTAIRNLYEMGVTTGTSATTFSPAGLVSRGQMAAFIARALAHTNARPSGLSAQTIEKGLYHGDQVEFTASMRDPNFAPLEGTLIDIFSAGAGDAFKDDGGCRTTAATDNEVVPTGPNTPCQISNSDPQTDLNGNVDMADLAIEAASGSMTVRVWTSTLGAWFDNDTPPSDLGTFDLTVSNAPVKFTFTDNLPEGIRRPGLTNEIPPATGSDDTRLGAKYGRTQVHYGNEVVITLQLVDSEGAAVSKPEVELQVTSVIQHDRDGNAQQTRDASDNSVVVQPVFETKNERTDTIETNESGQIVLRFTRSDPVLTDALSATALTVSFAESGVGGGVTFAGSRIDAYTPSGGSAVAAVEQNYAWNDDTAKPDILRVAERLSYVKASAETNLGASNTVTATLLDQYGDPARGGLVTVIGDDDADDGNAAARSQDEQRVADGLFAVIDPAVDIDSDDNNDVTGISKRANSRGKSVFGHSRKSNVGDIEWIFADHPRTNDGPIEEERAAILYWTVLATANQTTAACILVADVENNTLVYDNAGVPTQVTYGSGDQFFSAFAASPISMSDFEKALAAVYITSGTNESDRESNERWDQIAISFHTDKPDQFTVTDGVAGGAGAQSCTGHRQGISP